MSTVLNWSSDKPTISASSVFVTSIGAASVFPLEEQDESHIVAAVSIISEFKNFCFILILFYPVLIN
jgi:hypothetical protein